MARRPDCLDRDLWRGEIAAVPGIEQIGEVDRSEPALAETANQPIAVLRLENVSRQQSSLGRDRRKLLCLLRVADLAVVVEARGRFAAGMGAALSRERGPTASR